MMKNILAVAMTSVLVACGGGGSSSDNGNSSSSDNITISLDTVGHDATYLQAEDGSWTELPKSQTSLKVTKGTQVNLALFHQDGDKEVVGVFYASGERDLTADFTGYLSDDEAEAGRVGIESASPTISIVNVRLSGTIEVSTNSASLDSSTENRNLIATGYDATNQKAYFYKKTGLKLSDNDVVTLDFTDENVSKEVQVKSLIQKAGFEFNLDYSLALTTSEMPLKVSDGYVEVPTEFRIDGDVYRSNWQFGDGSAYNVYSSSPNVVNNLTSAPSEINSSDLVYSQDRKTVTLPVDLSSTGLLEELNSVTIEYDDISGQTTNDDSFVVYQVDGMLQEKGNLSFKLIDLNDLPNANISLNHPKTEDEVYLNLRYGNVILGQSQLHISP